MQFGLMFLVSDQNKCLYNITIFFLSPCKALPDPQVSIIQNGSLIAGHTTFFLTCCVMLVPHLVVEPSFVWTKEDNTSHSIGSKPHLHFTSLKTSDSGNYSCTVMINTTDETSVSGEDTLYLIVTSK